MADPVRRDHATEALAAIPPTLDKPNWRALITSSMAQMQAIEDAAIAIIVQRALADAVGAQIDQLGKLVGQPREGREDDDYRRVIGCKIAVNESQGMREDLIRVARLALLDPSVRVRLEAFATPGAEQAMTLEGLVADAVATDVAHFAQRAAHAGVRVIVESWPAPVAEMLRLDDDAPGAGFAVTPRVDLALVTTFDSIICVHPDFADDPVTLSFVESFAAPATGELDETAYPDIVFRFVNGLTTIGDCENRINESPHIFVGQTTTALPTETMHDADDDFPATTFAAAVAGGVFATAQDGSRV